jgi:AcrR family transcriptional regulator
MRNADVTRARLVDSALHEFARAPFDRVGLRDIAAGADVDVALVRRYFGSKEGLFVAAIQSQDDLDELFAGDLHSIAVKLAETSLGKGDARRIEPLLALLHSAGIEPATGMLRGFLDAAITGPLASKIDSADAQQRAAIVLAIVTGVSLFSGVMKLNAFDDNRAVELVTVTIENVLRG